MPKKQATAEFKVGNDLKFYFFWAETDILGSPKLDFNTIEVQSLGVEQGFPACCSLLAPARLSEKLGYEIPSEICDRIGKALCNNPDTSWGQPTKA